MPESSDYTKWLKHKVDSALLDSDKSSRIAAASRHSNISKIPLSWYRGMIGSFSRIVNFITMTVVAGTGVSGVLGEGGPALSAQLTRTRGIGLDRTKENLFIVDGSRVLKMNLNTRIITRVAGDPAKGNAITGSGIITSFTTTATTVTYTIFGTNTFVQGQSVRIIDIPLQTVGGVPNQNLNITGLIKTVSGSTVTLDRNGVSSGGASIAVLGSIGTLAVNAGIGTCYNVVTDSKENIYFANQDASNSCILKVDTDGYISRYCGVAGGGAFVNDVPRLNTNVRIGGPRGIAIDSSDNLYFCDTDNGFTVRKIDALTNKVFIIAGKFNEQATVTNPARPYPTDGELGTNVRFRNPTAVTLDLTGQNLYILSIYGNVGEYNGIYRYNFQDQKVYVVLQSLNGTSGDGGPVRNAQIFNPRGLEFDELGNIYLSTDMLSIRKIDTNGIITRYTDSNNYDVVWHLAVRSPTEIYSCGGNSNQILVTTPYSRYV
jgi:hypothetical protein